MSNSHQDNNGVRLSLYYEAKRKFSRGCILKTAIASFAVCAMILPDLALSAPITSTGTVAAKFTITFKSAPPAGSTVSCSVLLIGSDSRSPSDSKFATAPVTDTSAVCQVTVPYRWHLSAAGSNMTIAYSVNGPAQGSSGIYDVIAVPANGTITKVAVAITQ